MTEQYDYENLKIEFLDYMTSIEEFMNTVDILNGYQKYYCCEYKNFWRFEKIIELIQQEKNEILLKAQEIKQII